MTGWALTRKAMVVCLPVSQGGVLGAAGTSHRGEAFAVVPAGKANPAPPIGPALGQHGVNIMAFCKDFNAKSQKLGDTVVPVIMLVAIFNTVAVPTSPRWMIEFELTSSWARTPSSNPGSPPT